MLTAIAQGFIRSRLVKISMLAMRRFVDTQMLHARGSTARDS